MDFFVHTVIILYTLWSVCFTAHVPHRQAVLTRLGHHKVAESHHHDITPAPNVANIYRDICTNDAECVLPVQCPAHVHEETSAKCHSSKGRIGICCSTGKNHTGPISEKGRHHEIVKLDSVTLGAVSRHSRLEMTELHSKERRILHKGRSAVLQFGTASYGHFKNSRLFSMVDLTQVMGIANRALEIALATRAFKDRQGITNHQLEYGMIKQDLRPTPLGAACPVPPTCAPIPPRHRLIDGSCNNAQFPAWGVALTPYSRLLPPSYHDGIWTPRVSEDRGQQLHSPRSISSTLFPDNDNPNEDYTLMLMQFGQFLSHDITQSLDTSFSNGSAISCCTDDGTDEINSEFRHYACMPIHIPPKDDFFSTFNQKCMNFVRSVLSPRHDCTLGYAQQMNKVTHFIDGSCIYGSSSEQTRSLRSFYGGGLKTFNDFGRELLPLSEDTDACLTREQGSACFNAGDTRTNQMVSLVVLHTLFMREHNRIAEELQYLNPHWDDEKLFLETRRIVAAVLQVITYNEFLPALLGDSTMEEFDLDVESGDYYSYDYDHRIDPSILNEFASAAFRFGHSMVEGMMKLYGAKKMEAAVDIPSLMFSPARMRKREFYDQMLSTMTTEPIQDVDNSISDSLTKYMFRGGNPFGVDIASINIQRGRDHGLRPYNDYRELVGQPRITSFYEFGPEMSEKLQLVYNSVDDIDLWVGGLLEPKYEGSVLGLTFRDIIAEQFSRLKKGDKYFFEYDASVNPGYFTPEQLVELRKVTLSRIICDNRDGILLVRQAPNSFRKPGVPGNEFVDCSSPIIPHLNLFYWKEYP